MVTTIMTTKGQIVIPSKIRRRFHMKAGTKLCVVEKDNEIVLQPLTHEFFERTAGILKTKGKLTQALLKERRRERELEDKKWSKS